MKTYRIYFRGKFRDNIFLPETPRTGDWLNYKGELWLVDYAQFEAGQEDIDLFLTKTLHR